MIDWIISFFYFGAILGILSFEMMITVNLVLLIVCRGLLIVIISYILYKKGFLDKNSREYSESRRKFVRFSLKQIIVILIAVLYFPLSLFFSLYALLKLSNYFSNEKSVFQKKRVNLLGRIMIFLIPLIFILWFGLFEQDTISVFSIALCVLIYFYREADSPLNIAEISRNVLHKFHPLIKSIFLIMVISLPITIIIASGIYQTENKFTVMVQMEDGVQLSTDVYFAPGSFGSPRPVILIRTPYGKSGWADDLYLPF